MPAIHRKHQKFRPIVTNDCWLITANKVRGTGLGRRAGRVGWAFALGTELEAVAEEVDLAIQCLGGW